MAKRKKKVKAVSTESLLQQTNELLRIQLILQLASYGMTQQKIRKIVGVDMKFITNILKPLKGKIDSNS